MWGAGQPLSGGHRHWYAINHPKAGGGRKLKHGQGAKQRMHTLDAWLVVKCTCICRLRLHA